MITDMSVMILLLPQGIMTAIEKAQHSINSHDEPTIKRQGFQPTSQVTLKGTSLARDENPATILDHINSAPKISDRFRLMIA